MKDVLKKLVKKKRKKEENKLTRSRIIQSSNELSGIEPRIFRSSV